jgi:hypothetical protein
MGYALTMSVPDDREPDLSTQPPRSAPATRRSAPQGMVPARERRRTKAERGFMRLVATGGIVGIAVALGAILTSQDVAGWITGLTIGLTSVILAALLWSSRQL